MSHAGNPLGFAPFDGNGQRVELSDARVIARSLPGDRP
jgi:hypothetical protein